MKSKVLLKGFAVLLCLLMLSAPSVMAQGEPCTADFDCTQTVDADDVTEFLNQFGRSQYYDPCPDCYDSPCPCTAPGCDPPAPVAKTGQTTSYATGDDGDYEYGVAWPNPRFTDNGDGTITDNLTGLIWLKLANCFGRRDWATALTDCNTLNSEECYLTDGSIEGDWRLPSIKEFSSLIDFTQYNPALPSGHPFAGVQSVLYSYYWSSTSYGVNTLGALLVYMYNGFLIDKDKTEDFYYVWPVRGGRGCIEGETSPCGATDVGECEYGTKACGGGGIWGACVGGVYPVEEICDDDVDNDCDGMTDYEDQLDCPCKSATVRCENHDECCDEVCFAGECF